MIAGKFSQRLHGLGQKISALHLNPDMLVGRHIPNPIAKPFDVTKEYAQIIYNQTSSRLDKVLRKWNEKDGGSTEQRQQLAYVILVEFLVYQFASPVRRTETQDLLFTVHDIERFIDSPLVIGDAFRRFHCRLLKAPARDRDQSGCRKRSLFISLVVSYRTRVILPTS